jgi:hypothetical protein
MVNDDLISYFNEGLTVLLNFFNHQKEKILADEVQVQEGWAKRALKSLLSLYVHYVGVPFSFVTG